MESTPRPLPSGPDNGRAPIQPDSLQTSCQCIRCRLTAIHGDLLRIACNAPSVVESPVVEVAHSVFDLLRHDSGDCLLLVDLVQRLESETVSVAGTLQGIRLNKIADDLKRYAERIDK